MLELATMDEWWRLTDALPEYRRRKGTALKDFGYLKLFELIEPLTDRRILEFGHGFNASLLSRYQDQHQMWGLDAPQDLPYFPSGDRWEAVYRDKIESVCPRVELRRGLLGTGDPVDIPPASMDLIASVSVLEEIPRNELAPLVEHAAGLLAPGGRFLGTCDVQLARPGKVRALLDAIRGAGLVMADPERSDLPDRLDDQFHDLLLEDPTTVMVTYQMNDGDDRRYNGHWGTAWFVAETPG